MSALLLFYIESIPPIKMNEDIRPFSKIGEFDWIASFSQLEPHIAWASSSCGIPRAEQKVLVIGCGTSPLSVHLVQNGFGSVLSLDNDEDCIRHMKRLHTDNCRLRWLHYDMVTQEGADADELRALSEGFDLIIDKGTLDAIMVEGSCWQMLAEVYRLLASRGVYLLCSIHTRELLQNLLSIPSLNWTVEFSTFSVPASENSCNDTIAVCRRKNPSVVYGSLDLASLAQEEEQVLDTYFKLEHPYLTPELTAKIRSGFALADGDSDGDASSVRLTIKDAYRILFTEQLAAEDYTYELFLEDLASFPLQEEGRISVDEALRFIEQMQ